MNNKVSITQGTRDFPPTVMRKRNYIFSTIRKVFECYGFEQLETPAFENLETLMGKYGEEGDKLIFKILNNGLNNEKNIVKARAAFENVLAGKNSADITERALKYDLTIPFARYVAMNNNKLNFPFKRYQMQPVWRADRPQKGRYREFYQCDADIVGSTSLINEIELAIIYETVFSKLGIDVNIKINNRKIFAGIAESVKASDKMMDMAIAIDKFDKIGLDGVKKELNEKGFTDEQIADLTDFIFAISNKIVPINEDLNDQGDPAFQFLEKAPLKYAQNENFRNGVVEIKEVINNVRRFYPESKIKIDLTLARGLNYYTGIIFEVAANGSSIGSIGGGGRYDDLTGLFGVPGIPGVGISFGVDRIYDLMEEMALFPENLGEGTKLLFFNMGENESLYAFEAMQQLRSLGIACELFHQQQKLDKQFKYAENKQIPYVIIIGSREMEEGSCQVKHLPSGRQEQVAIDQLTSYFNTL